MVNPLKKITSIPETSKEKLRATGREMINKKVNELVDNIAPELKQREDWELVRMAISYVYAFYNEAKAVQFIGDLDYKKRLSQW